MLCRGSRPPPLSSAPTNPAYAPDRIVQFGRGGSGGLLVLRSGLLVGYQGSTRSPWSIAWRFLLSHHMTRRPWRRRPATTAATATIRRLRRVIQRQNATLPAAGRGSYHGRLAPDLAQALRLDLRAARTTRPHGLLVYTGRSGPVRSIEVLTAATSSSSPLLLLSIATAALSSHRPGPADSTADCTWRYRSRSPRRVCQSAHTVLARCSPIPSLCGRPRTRAAAAATTTTITA
jgi:hypothetical protein